LPLFFGPTTLIAAFNAVEVEAPSFFTVKPPRSLPPATWADPVTFRSDPDLAANAPPATARTSEARTAMARTRRRTAPTYSEIACLCNRTTGGWTLGRNLFATRTAR